MINKTKKHLNLKIALVVSFLVFFVLTILLVKTTMPRLTSKAIGAEDEEIPLITPGESPLVCREQPSFTIPFLDIDLAKGPNNLEIPIGEAIDETEAVAEEIIKQMQVIIDATAIEADAASQMVELARACDEDLCEKNCELQAGSCACEEYECTISCDDPLGRSTCSLFCLPGFNCCYHAGTGCTAKKCSGSVCPPGNLEQIGRLQNIIEKQVEIINNAYKIIENIFTWKQHKPIGAWWQPLFCIGCRTDIEQIQEKLEKSRSGDYLTGLQGIWYRDPPGLKDCIIRPEEEEAFLRGEKVGKFLFTCPDLIKFGIIDEDPECSTDKTKCLCYGYNEGTNPGRASNFICCK